jgi:nicotinamidase-related amidase
MTSKTIAAEPYELEFDPATTALLIIDMQRDFVMPGGFGEALGNDVSQLQVTIAPTKAILEGARKAGMLVIHTREGHRPDLSDCPPAKLVRGRGKTRIGDPGPMGRILVRGEVGHDIVPELYPIAGEVVIDKPGKGAFFATDLELILRDRGVKTLIVCGVTTEVCVNTTVRERPRLRVRGAVRLRGLLFPRVPEGGAGHDQSPGRHLRLGIGLQACADGAGGLSGTSVCRRICATRRSRVCAEGKDQRPFHCGGRFCMNASIPSPTSSASMLHAMTSAAY